MNRCNIQQWNSENAVLNQSTEDISNSFYGQKKKEGKNLGETRSQDFQIFRNRGKALL